MQIVLLATRLAVHGRVDPAWVTSYGWQSFHGQNQLLEFGKKPFAAGENGGIAAMSCIPRRVPLDDPALLLQLTWEPQVPHVTITFTGRVLHRTEYQPSRGWISTATSSWDDWGAGLPLRTACRT